MPGKEAEVERIGVVPEPVTKEIPKCESASQDVKVQIEASGENAETVTDDSQKPQPQDTEITSSGDEKVETTDVSNVEAKKVDASSESANGSEPKVDEKTKAEGTPAADEANGKKESAPSIEEPSESKVETMDGDVKEPEVSAKPAETIGDGSKISDDAATKLTATENPEEKENSSEPAVNSKNSENAEGTEENIKSSEAAAKPIPADDEKIVVEKTSEQSSTPEVTGSSEGVAPESMDVSQKDASAVSSSGEKPSAENPSSSETKPDGLPGSSSTTEAQPDVEYKIEELRKQGLSLYVRRDFCAAADAFGKVLELQAPLYGEMSEKLAETYYLYGTAMYEYGKTENTVLGEKVKEKDEEDEEDEEQMDVDGNEAEPAETAADSSEQDSKEPDVKAAESIKSAGEVSSEPADETITDDKEEDDDDAFRVSWEMLELAKATFLKANNKKRLADTLMKLGEVGIETGNSEAIAEMVEGLKVRKEVYPANHRIIPETHFNIGVAYAFFEKYDDAIEHFTEAKSCLERRIEELSSSEVKADQDEVEEIKKILPEIQEKIQDTKESKADKEKIKETEGETSSKEVTPFPVVTSEAKPVSDISHLVKRKRKVDDILPERAAKQIRQDDGAQVASTTEDELQTVGNESKSQPDDNQEKDSSKLDEPSTTEVTKPAVTKVTEPTTTEATELSNNEVTEPASTEVTGSTTMEVTDPSTTKVTEPPTKEVTEPTATDVTEPSTKEVTEPAATEVTEPTTMEVTAPTDESEKRDETESLNDGDVAKDLETPEKSEIAKDSEETEMTSENDKSHDIKDGALSDNAKDTKGLENSNESSKQPETDNVVVSEDQPTDALKSSDVEMSEVEPTESKNDQPEKMDE